MKSQRQLVKLCLSLLSLIIIISGCAKEMSQEEVDREQRVRSESRYKPVAGEFDGYIDRGNGQYVPLSLSLSTDILSGVSSAQISASMHIGLFGGVNVASQSVSYDWGVGLLVVSFGKSNGSINTSAGGRNQSTPLQLRADLKVIKDENNKNVVSLVNATLRGDNSGVQKVVFRPTLKDYFTTQDQYDYEVRFEKNSQPVGHLYLVPAIEGRPAKNDIDLPEIPALLGSMRFFGYAGINNSFEEVIYDPLRGRMDIVLQGDNRIKITGLALSSESPLLLPQEIRGTVLQGGKILSSFYATQSKHSIDDAAFGEGEAGFRLRGSLHMGSDSDAMPATGILQFLRTEGKNPPELPFVSFPSMSLKVTPCLPDGRDLGQYDFEATAVDPIKGTAVFRDMTSGRIIQLVAQFGRGFRSFSGNIESFKSTRSSVAYLKLKYSGPVTSDASCH